MVSSHLSQNGLSGAEDFITLLGWVWYPCNCVYNNALECASVHARIVFVCARPRLPLWQGSMREEAGLP